MLKMWANRLLCIFIFSYMYTQWMYLYRLFLMTCVVSMHMYKYIPSSLVNYPMLVSQAAQDAQPTTQHKRLKRAAAMNSEAALLQTWVSKESLLTEMV